MLDGVALFLLCSDAPKEAMEEEDQGPSPENVEERSVTLKKCCSLGFSTCPIPVQAHWSVFNFRIHEEDDVKLEEGSSDLPLDKKESTDPQAEEDAVKTERRRDEKVSWHDRSQYLLRMLYLPTFLSFSIQKSKSLSASPKPKKEEEKRKETSDDHSRRSSSRKSTKRRVIDSASEVSWRLSHTCCCSVNFHLSFSDEIRMRRRMMKSKLPKKRSERGEKSRKLRRRRKGGGG